VLLITVTAIGLNAGAALPAVQRPIEDFVNAQGEFCLDPDTFCEGDGVNCFLFVPPTPNFLGSSDPDANICASVDYAGLMDAWITSESGGAVTFDTQFSGGITERPLADGRAEVHVRLRTTNALTWVVDGCDFAGGDLLFGERAPEVLAGSPYVALGDYFLELVLIISEPGADLPDLMELFVCEDEPPDWELRFIAVRANIRGPLREAFGVPDGTPGRVQITQTGLFMTGFHGAVADGFPVEHIKLHVLGE
jgi:hypothetical protein